LHHARLQGCVPSAYNFGAGKCRVVHNSLGLT
jgi:hypothetical protein